LKTKLYLKKKGGIKQTAVCKWWKYGYKVYLRLKGKFGGYRENDGKIGSRAKSFNLGTVLLGTPFKKEST